MGLLEDLNSGKYNLIIFAIIFMLFFHQYWNNMKTNENMADVSQLTEEKVKELIYKTYLVDVTAIKNLSDIAVKLQSGGLTIPGDLTVTGSFNYLPKGTIVAWNGNAAPAGWTLCDGSNGSPDLRNRFVLGWGSRGINAQGGEETVTLNINQMPSHAHSGTTNDGGNHAHGYLNAGLWGGGNSRVPNGGDWGNNGNWQNTGDAGNHNHGFSTNAQGGNQPHNNMPPFYVLAYIMKL